MFLKIAKIWREKKEKRKRGLELSYMYPTASDRRCAALRFCLLLRPFTSATLSSHNWLFSKLRKRSEQTPNHHRITCSVTERSRVPSAGNKGDSFTASSFDSFVLPSFLPSLPSPTASERIRVGFIFLRAGDEDDFPSDDGSRVAAGEATRVAAREGDRSVSAADSELL